MEWTSDIQTTTLIQLIPDMDGVLYQTESGAHISTLYFTSCFVTLIIAAWIVWLNSVVIHTLLYGRHDVRVSDYFVSSLAIADLLTGLVMFYITTYSLIQYQNYWECLFRFGLTYTISESAYMHLFAITIDRYIKIVHPLHYTLIFTKTKVVIISITIWIICTVIGLLPLMGWNHKYVDRSSNGTVCRFFGVLPDGYFLFNLTLSSITVAITVILYGRIVYIARQQYMEIKSQTTPFLKTSRPRFDKHAWKLAKTIAIVVFVSNLCWLPGIILLLLHITGTLDQYSVSVQGDMVTYCGLTVFLNSLINPIIYASKIDIVNKRFRAIFCCKKSHTHGSGSGPINMREI